MDAEQASPQAPADEQDQPAVEPTPDTESTSVTPDQPEEPSTPDQEAFTNFKLADVPEEHRQYVEQAYKQLQGDYSRKTADLAEQRKSAQEALNLAEYLNTPEGQAQIFRQLAEIQGYELQDEDVEDEPDEDLTPEEALQARIDKLEQALEQRAETERMSAEQKAENDRLQWLDEQIDQRLGGLEHDGEALSEDYANAVVSHALAAFPPDENGVPQIQKAFDALEAEWKRRETKWAASKDAPHVSTAGQSASQVPDLDDDKARQQWMMDRLNGADQ